MVPIPSALNPASQPAFLTLKILCWEGHTLICRVSELDRQVRSCSLVSLSGVGSSESISCRRRVLESQNLLVWLAFKLFDGDLDPAFVCKNAYKSFTKQ